MIQPSRPPPPPPEDQSTVISNQKSLCFEPKLHPINHSHPRNKSRSEYIKISECHSGFPDKPLKANGFKSRASTSFSSTLKPSFTSLVQTNHQKSRSLTENHIGSPYMYLDFPSSLQSRNSNKKDNDTTQTRCHHSVVYKTVDFNKTDALTKCIVQRQVPKDGKLL